MSFDTSRQTSTQYPVTLYREFLNYVKTKYAGEYWHVLPKQVASYVRMALKPHNTLDGLRSRRLFGKRAAVLLFSHYPADPRPRRAAEALATQGVTVDLICLRDGGDDQAQKSYGTVNVTRVHLKRRRGGKLGYIGQYSAFIVISLSLPGCAVPKASV